MIKKRHPVPKLPSKTHPESPDAAEVPATLEERVQRIFPRLTSKRRNLARIVLDDPYFVAFASADQFAERAGVDPATVVRFSRALGYDGFTDLKRAIQADVPQFLTAAEKVRRSLLHPASPNEAIEDMFAQDFSNVQSTAVLNERETITRAIDLLAKSKSTVILASGISTPVAWTLAHHLRLLGLPAIHSTAGVSAAGEIARLGSGDVVVGIALWRYVKTTLRLFEQARRVGASGIAITDSKASPLARLSDICLVAATGALEISHSLVGPMAIVNALATGIALLDPDRTIRQLAAVDQVYKAADITME